MNKILLVYYSRTGFTRRVAHEIAQKCQCDVEELMDVHDRSGICGYVRSLAEAFTKLRADYRSTAQHTRQYDLVVIGTPVWMWNLSSPIRSYIEQNRERFKAVAFFCTYGGSGAEGVLAEMEKLCGKKPRATLHLRDDEITGHRYLERLDAFVQQLRGSRASVIEMKTRSARARHRRSA